MTSYGFNKYKYIYLSFRGSGRWFVTRLAAANHWLVLYLMDRFCIRVI